MSFSHWRRVCLSAVAASALMALAAPAVAEISVLESTAPGLKSGARLPDDASVDIPAGKSLRVLLPSGQTKSINGPFHGRILGADAGKDTAARALERAEDIAKTGGGNQKIPGAMRSARPPTNQQ
jgi:hypothetical protein